MTVYFDVDSQSTAENGVDCGYISGTSELSSSGSVTFQAGQPTVDIPVAAIDDGQVEGDETLTITLTADASYTVGSPDSASLTIADDDQLAEVTIAATDATATETGPTTGQFTVTRTGNLTSALPVNYSVGGTADYYEYPDYSGLPNFDGMGYGWVTIPAGQASATITITPIDDTVVDASALETVVLTLTSGENYALGSPASAELTIADNDDVPMAGAYVTGAAPSGSLFGPVDRFTLTFNEGIQDGTFTLVDVVALSGPAGAIAATAVNKLSSAQYEVVFATQTQSGTYTLSVGPEILNASGARMDQDQDTVCGEAVDDRFTTAVIVANATPTVATPIADQTVNEDASDTVIDLTGVFGDSDIAAGDSLSYQVLANSDPSLLTASVLGASLTLDYPADRHGSASVTIRATDTRGAYADDTFLVTVNPVNDAPVAADDTAATKQGAPVNVDVLANDGDVDGNSVSITILSATSGTAVLNDGGTPLDTSDDTVDFTPAAGFSGTASFTYQLSDGTAQSNTATVTVTVAVNAAPVAVADAVATNVDAAVNVDVLANDSDADGDPLWITVVGATSGTAVLNNGGTPADPSDDTVDFTPAPGFYGTAGFTYRLSDGFADSQIATVTVSVNAPPTAAGDTAVADEDLPVLVDVLANDSDVESGPLWITVLESTHGTAVVDDGGTPGDSSDDAVLFTPAENFHGTAGFTYRLSDGIAQSQVATVSITVDPLNDPPVALGETIEVAEGGTATVLVGGAGSVLANDTDVDLPTDSLSVDTTPVSGPAHGTLTLGADGSFSYVHDGSEHFSDSFTYRVVDSNLAAATATVTITISPVNDNAPAFTSPAAASVVENATAVVTVLASDADLPSQTLVYSITGGADQARFTINAATGELSFLAAPDYDAPVDADGDNTYLVEVTADDQAGRSTVQAVAVSVTAVNDNAPAFSSSASASVVENTTAVVTVQATDADLPAQTIVYAITGGADQSQFTMNAATGELSFLTAPDYGEPADADGNNVYLVEVTAGDQAGRSSVQVVHVTVLPENHYAPVFVSPAVASVAENTTAALTVQATDADVHTLTILYAITGGADQARFTINAVTGELSFLAAPDYDAPADAGSDNTYLVEVTADDQVGRSTVQAIAVTVTGVNDNAPVFTSPAAASVVENATMVVTVQASDADLPAQPLAYSITGGADQARFTINAVTGGLSFLTAPDYDAPVDADGDNTYLVEVTADDQAGLATVQAIVVTVTGVNDNTPTFTSSATASVVENTMAVVTVSAADADLPAQTLAYAITGGADQARFTINAASGALSFLAAPDFEAPADANADNVYLVEVTADDQAGRSAVQAIQVTVLPTPEPPRVDLDANNTSGATGTGYAGSFVENGGAVAVADIDAVISADTTNLAWLTITITNLLDAAEESLSADVTGTNIEASYADGVLTLSGVASVIHYEQVLRTVRYNNLAAVPTTSDRTIAVVANDGTATSQTSTAVLSVELANDRPVGTAQSLTTAEDAALAIVLAGADGDPEVTQTLSFALFSQPSHGTLSGFDRATGQLTYTPAANFVGQDSFQFVVIDDDTAGGDARYSAPVSVTITVTAVNDAPSAANQTLGTGVGVPLLVDLGDDGDPEVVQQLTLTVITPPAHGTLSGFDTATGEILYTPEAGYLGEDSFSITLTDDAAAGEPAALSSATAVISILVAYRPLADTQSVATAEDTALAITLAGDDGDPGATHALSFAVTAGPSHGTISGFDPATGQFTYTPAEDYYGSDSLSFTVAYTTPGGAVVTSAPAEVQIAVSAVNDTPQAADQAIRTGREVAVSFDLGDDGDAEVVQQLTLTVTTPPAHGTLSGFNAATGEVIYTPAPGFTGSDTFRYTLTDDAAAGEPAGLVSAAATVSILVLAPATALPQAVTTDEDVPLVVTLTADAADPTMLPDLVFVLVDPPQHGEMGELDPATGKVAYTPAKDYHGTDSFTFLVRYEASGGVVLTSSPATVAITVAPVNDRPLASVQLVTLAAGAAFTLDLGDDGDPEVAQQLTLTILAQPSHGTLSQFDPATGKVLYTPEPGYTGADSFRYTLTDDAAAGPAAALTSEEGVIAITLAAPPMANAQSLAAGEDTPLTLTLTGQASVPEGKRLVYSIVSEPANGTLSAFDPETGQVTYTPDADFNGSDSFRFLVTEYDVESGRMGLRSQRAVVSITVAAANDAPLGTGQNVATGKGTPLTVTLVGDDGDAEVEQTLTFAILAQPSHGTLSEFDPATGTLLYTPAAGYYGPDSFTFTVTDDASAGGAAVTSASATVEVFVAAPPLAHPHGANTAEDTPISLTLTASDGDPQDPASLRFVIVSPPQHGQITAWDQLTGQFTYAPDADYVGADSFQVAVIDDQAGPELALESAPVLVTLVINAVNDAPVAIAQEAWLVENTWANLMLGSDGDAEASQALTLNIVTAPSHGTLSGFDPLTGQVRYTPQQGYVGTDAFSFTLTDDATAGTPGALVSAAATVSITVAAGNHAPVANPQAVFATEDLPSSLVLTGDDGEPGTLQVLTFRIVTPPEHGEITAFDPATGQLTYQPDPGYHGMDRFQFVVIDDGSIGHSPALASPAATLVINVTSVNDAPQAEPLALTAAEDQPLPIRLIGDDGDDDLQQTLTFTIVTPPSHGTLSEFDPATGTLVYTPSANYRGADSFTYTVSDDETAGGQALTSSTETMSITLLESHQAAVAAPLMVRTVKGQTLAITLANVGNPDAAKDLTYAIVSGPANGTLSGLNAATGTVTYTPAAGFSGTDLFTFSLVDNASTSAATTSVVEIQVNDVTATAVAVNDAVTVRASDGDLYFDVLANDTYNGSGSLAIVSVSTPSYGTATIAAGDPNASGSAARDRIRFTPPAGYTGTQTISYTIEDAWSNQSTASLQVTVATSGAAVTGGAISLGGTGFQPKPEAAFTPPVAGDFAAAGGLSDQPFTMTWTDPSGAARNLSGTEDRTTTVLCQSGSYSYSETVVWSYDVTGDGVHVWGGYTYTFTAWAIGDMEGFFYLRSSDDWYTITSTSSSSGTDSGNSSSTTVSGHQHDSATFIKTMSSAGGSAITDFTNLTTTGYSGSGSYWYTTPGGSASGTTSTGGSTFDFSHATATWTYLVPTDTWTATGGGFGFGHGNDGSSHNGSGTYLSDDGTTTIAGSMSERGSQSGNWNYVSTITLLSDLTWSTTGTGHASSRGSSEHSYTGSGSYHKTGSTANGSWSTSGSAAEGGQGRSRWSESIAVSLAGGGWTATSGNGSASDESSSWSCYSGGGTYTSSSASDGGSYSVTGGVTEYGGGRDHSRKSVNSTYDGAVWTTTGTGSGSGETGSFRSFSGVGTFSNVIPGGSVSGMRLEFGFTDDAKRQSTNSTLADGNWTTTGSASGSSSSYRFSLFSGTGSYARNHVNGTATQFGWEETQNESYPQLTLTAGSWQLTDGSGSQTNTAYNESTYCGSGTFSETSSSGTRHTHTTYTRWEDGGEWNYSRSQTQSGVAGGLWVTVSGSASGEGASRGSNSFSGNGSYHYSFPGATVSGRSTASGSSSTSSSYTTRSTWDPAAPASGGGYGAWVTSGTSSGSSTNTKFNSYSGGGSYSLPRHAGELATGRHDSTASGSITEDGEDRSFASNQWKKELQPDGQWALTSGSGSSSGNGHTSFHFETSGTYQKAFSSGPNGYTVNGTTTSLQERRHQYGYSGASQVIGGEWKTVSGSGSASGFTHDQESMSGTGSLHRVEPERTVNASLIERSGKDDRFDYRQEQNVGTDHLWHTTGSATGHASATTFNEERTLSASYTRNAAGATVSGSYFDLQTDQSNYRFTSHFDYQEATGDWRLVSGSGSSYAGSGPGNEYSGSGSYSQSGSSTGEGGEVTTWSLAGTITESGRKGFTAGEWTRYGVSGGAWTALSTSGSASSSGNTNFHNSATGSYTRGSFSGSFWRNEMHTSNDRFGWSVSGSGSGSASGTGSSRDTRDYSYSYSGSASQSLYGYSGTLSERGGNYHGGTVESFFALDEEGQWQVSSATRSDWSGDWASAAFHGSDPYSGSGSDDYGTWSYSGTANLDVEEGYAYDDNWDFDWIDDEWKASDGWSLWTTHDLVKTSYADSGSYTSLFGGGSISGTDHANGHDRASYDTRTRVDLSSSGLTRTVSATSISDIQHDTSYSGSGGYVYGAIAGSITEGGGTSYLSYRQTDYKRLSDGWYASGRGNGHDSRNWSYGYSGSGAYTFGTLSGTQGESGGESYSYSRTYDEKLGEGSQWFLMSGSGGTTWSGNYHHGASGSGGYSASFDGGAGTITGTRSSHTNNGWSYSVTEHAQVVGHRWATSGSGSLSEYNGGGNSYSGSGSYGTADFHVLRTENGGQGNSNQYELRWQWGSAGRTSQATSTSTGNSYGAYSYQSSGSSDVTVADPGYAGGNGWLTHSESEWDYSISESYGWSARQTTWANTAADGTVTTSSFASGSGGGAGSVHDYLDGLSEQTYVETGAGYSHTEYHMSAGGHDHSDSYGYTGSWDETVGTDGTITFNATLSNPASGAAWEWVSTEDWWETVTSYENSGGEWVTETASGSSSGTWTSPTYTYSHSLDYAGFYEYSYTGRTGAYGSPPFSSNGSYTIPGPPPEEPGSDSGSGGSGGGTTPPSPTIGDWHRVTFSGGGGEEESLISGKAFLVSAGGGEASWEQIIDAAFGDESDWLDNLVDGFCDVMEETYEQVVNLPETLWDFGLDAADWLINDGLDHASNFFCGFGDVVSCGLTARYREAMGFDSFVDTGSAMYTAGAIAGTVESVALGVVSPCGAAGGVGTAIRALNGMQAVGNGLNLYDNVVAGNYGSAAFDALGLLGNVGQIFRPCFAAGTPLLTPGGSKPIEEFRVGDEVLATPEHDPCGAVEARLVEEVFERVSPLLRLVVGGQTIRTTAEHPFYVEGRGWVKCCMLAPGDLLRSHDGRFLPVESVSDGGEFATVYNLRIAEYHTYYVGDPMWGFSVWSHNSNCALGSGRDAVQEALENGEISIASRIRAGIGGIGEFANHHIFPQAFRTWFARRGILVDDFLVRIERTFHEALHAGQSIYGPGGWYSRTVMDALRAAERALPTGSRLNAQQIQEIVNGLLPRFGLPPL